MDVRPLAHRCADVARALASIAADGFPPLAFTTPVDELRVGAAPGGAPTTTNEEVRR